MRHRKSGRKLNRMSSHRKAMLRNMSVSLLSYECIRTTISKAKELRTIIEPLITLAKREVVLRKEKDSMKGNKFDSQVVALRRRAFNYLRNKAVVKKLFEIIAPRYQLRSGGYVHFLKCGRRFGDQAPMAIIKLIDNNKSKAI